MPMFKPIRSPGALGGYLPQGMRPPAQPLWQTMSQAPALPPPPPLRQLDVPDKAPFMQTPPPSQPFGPGLPPAPLNNPFGASVQNYFSNPAQWNAGAGQAMSPMPGQQIMPGVPPVGAIRNASWPQLRHKRRM